MCLYGFQWLPMGSTDPYVSLWVPDPYVKASLMAEGRRLKKRKTSIKKNTLNPSYNEALVFDVPHESVNHVSITIAVMDYDCIGHNEVMGLYMGYGAVYGIYGCVWSMGHYGALWGAMGCSPYRAQ
ncbi:synaptotagmin-C-like isoform X2 [Coturnix japonica]|uniref:synaptotagmin-C-like isoform X2 n=1 Tax=Coturnix japonica TaxID=93934 RepID=UPI000777CC15|nr:synaptotagmin-C-like isoform X2 [Coturnix japonica]